MSTKEVARMNSVSESAARTGDIQALHRALDVLESIARAGDMGVSELGRSLGLHTSTVHNILRTLSHRHYLVPVEGRYSLGPAPIALAAGWDAQRALPQTIAPALQDVVAQTGQAATASILVGIEGVKIGRSVGSGLSISEPAWRWSNALSMPTTRLLLAISQPDRWWEVVERYGAESQPAWNEDDWRRELDRLMATGLCEQVPAPNPRSVAIAVPVWSIGGTVVASIGSFCLGSEVSLALLTAMLDALWAATVRVSNELGCDEIPLPKPSIALWT